MDEIEDFITDHHYNQAIRKKSIISPEDAIAEAVLNRWPDLPADLAAVPVEQYAKQLTFEQVFSTPVGVYFLTEKQLAAKEIREQDIEAHSKTIRTLEDFRLEKQHTLALVERFVQKIITCSRGLPVYKSVQALAEQRFEALTVDYDIEMQKLIDQLSAQQLKPELEGGPAAENSVEDAKERDASSQLVPQQAPQQNQQDQQQQQQQQQEQQQQQQQQQQSTAARSAASRLAAEHAAHVASNSLTVAANNNNAHSNNNNNNNNNNNSSNNSSSNNNTNNNAAEAPGGVMQVPTRAVDAAGDGGAAAGRPAAGPPTVEIPVGGGAGAEEGKVAESASPEGSAASPDSRAARAQTRLRKSRLLAEMESASPTMRALTCIETEAPDEKVTTMVALEAHFHDRYVSFFEPVEEIAKNFYRPAYEELLKDPAAVARYRQVSWFAVTREARMSDFLIFRELGRGAFGVVFGSRHRMTGQLVALKGMSRRMLKAKKVIKLVKAEFDVLKKLGEFPSPFCISLSYAFSEPDDFYFGLPLMTGGDLMFHIYREGKPYSLERARFFAAEILLGIQHLHNLGIIYRDLKPENVLLDEHGHTKISDMGLAVLVKFTPFTRNGKQIRGRAGTSGYWPPEMIKGEGYAFDCDWWSYAAMVYEFIVGWCPFSEHNSKMERDQATVSWPISFPEIEGKPFPEEAESLLGKMLERDRHKRLGTRPDTPETIKAHPFFASIDWAQLETGKAPPPWKPPSNSINAASQADLQTRNQESKFKKIALTEEDNIEVNFKSREHLYDVTAVLHCERKGKLKCLEVKKSQACSLL